MAIKHVGPLRLLNYTICFESVVKKKHDNKKKRIMNTKGLFDNLCRA